MGLDQSQLSDLATIYVGHSFRGKIKNVPGSGLKVVQLRDVTPDLGINWEKCQETELVKPNSGNWLTKDDILLIARGRHFYATKITDIHVKAVASPHFYIIRIQNKCISPIFLSWYLNQSPVQTYLNLNASGSKSKSIRRKVIEKILIPIPSKSKQQSIINLVKKNKTNVQKLKELIDNNNKLLIKIAENLNNEATN